MAFGIQAYSLLNSGQSGNGSSSASVYVSDTPPVSPIEDQLWVNTSVMQLYVYYNDGDTTQWVNITGSYALSGSAVTVSASAPSSPTTNQLWLNTELMSYFIWYDDGDTTQWVQIG